MKDGRCWTMKEETRMKTLHLTSPPAAQMGRADATTTEHQGDAATISTDSS